jgi:5S rRNA maturation endonuclease (ribonuclease M5)
MHWVRRRDLEGGKELGVWLLVDPDASGRRVEEELYVESHEYRGGAFDVYTYTETEDWVHRGEYAAVEDAFDAALAYIEADGRPIAGR